MAKKTYLVESPLQHDGEPFAPGNKIEMDEAKAASLLVAGVLVDPVVAKALAKAEADAAKAEESPENG